MKIILTFLLFGPFLAHSHQLFQGAEKKNSIKQTSEYEGGIKWIDNLKWDDIVARAKKENKFIFVDAYASWCGPCKQMDKTVFPDKAVAELINLKFLSVKMQMDETEQDSKDVKDRYDDSRYISKTYRPEAFPCFLFFSPTGTIAHRSVGFQDREKFIALAKEALTDPLGKYQTNIQKFNSGQLEYEAMPMLARQAKKNGDRDIAANIAKTYKRQYLDLLSNDEAFNKDNLLFVAEFSYQLITSNDRYFAHFYRNDKSADSVMNLAVGNRTPKKIAERVIEVVIRREEIIDKLYNRDKPITHPKPNWNQIQSIIDKKYGKVVVRKFFPDDQIQFYKSVGDCKNYVKYVNRKIKMIPPKVGGNMFESVIGDSWGLNVYAWQVFKMCGRKRFLKQGLQWSNESIKLNLQERKDSSRVMQYLDTKANLLFRLGQTKNAIEIEKKAMGLLHSGNPLYNNFVEVIDKMEKGVPTWPQR